MKRPALWPSQLVLASLLFGGGCVRAPEVSPPAAPAPESAPAPPDRTRGLNRSCTSDKDCTPGQECVPFSYTSDTEGEAGLCELLCHKDGDCPAGYFCGHNAVNTSHDLCYVRAAAPAPKPPPAERPPAMDAGSRKDDLDF